MTVLNVTRPRENSNFTEHAQKPVCVSVLVLARRGSAAGETVKSVRTHAFPTSARTHAGQVTHTREAGMGCGSRPQLGLVSRSRRLPRRAREALWFLSCFLVCCGGCFCWSGLFLSPPPVPVLPPQPCLPSPCPVVLRFVHPPRPPPWWRFGPARMKLVGFGAWRPTCTVCPPGKRQNRPPWPFCTWPATGQPQRAEVRSRHGLGPRHRPGCRSLARPLGEHP